MVAVEHEASIEVLSLWLEVFVEDEVDDVCKGEDEDC